MFKVTTIITTVCLIMANGSAFALQALSDESLSDTTGQDGLTITLQNYAPNARIIWTDTNGINSTDGLNPIDFGLTGTPTPGSVVFGNGTTAGNFRVSNGTTFIRIDADGGNNAATLNIGVDLPDDLTINTGEVYVAGKDSNNVLINQTKIMKDMKVELGGLNLNIQLGNSPQGDLISIFGTITNGLKISNIGLIGAISAGNEYGIGIDEMTIRDNMSGSDLTINGVGINVTDAGLVITPSAGKQVDVLMQNFRLGNLSGSSAPIGGVALIGLQLGGTSLMISGH